MRTNTMTTTGSLWTRVVNTAFVLMLIAESGAAQQTPAAPPAPVIPAILQNYKPASAERLLKPEDGDWLMVRRTYDGWGYTPLDQITPSNVARLQPAWVFATGQTNGHEAAPIINNGVMFVATPGNQVIALDARTGAILWRYKRELVGDRLVLHPASAAVAVAGEKGFF